MVSVQGIDDDAQIESDKRQLFSTADNSGDNFVDPIVTSSIGEMRKAELPPANLTRSLLAKFQTMENRHVPPPSPARTEQQLKIAALPNTSGISRGLNQQTSSTSVTENIDRDEYEIERDEYRGNVQDYSISYESVEDVDSTTNVHAVVSPQSPVVDELPEQGTTRNLLAKFKSMQQQQRSIAK